MILPQTVSVLWLKRLIICRDAVTTIDLSEAGDKTGIFTLDLLVENVGRANYGRPHEFVQKKGLWEGPGTK